MITPNKCKSCGFGCQYDSPNCKYNRENLDCFRCNCGNSVDVVVTDNNGKFAVFCRKCDDKRGE